jgi:multidrug resistance efflux pump
MKQVIFLLTLATAFGFYAGMAMASEPVMAQKMAENQVQQQQQIYGSQLMTQQERMEFRAKMRAAKTAEERQKIREEHHAQMQERAKEKGVTLPDVAPGQGMMRDSGMGQGMGPGMGMGRGGGK